MTTPAEDRTQPVAVCYRHANRPTNVRCQNCEKPICADCMRDTPVGFRCPDCAGRSKPIFDEGLIVTKAIIGVNIAVFVIGLVLQMVDGAMGNVLTSGGGDLTTDGGLIVSAVTNAGTPIGVSQGEWWRLVTSGFLHGGMLHIAFNMYFIWVFGQMLEPGMRRLRFGLLYLCSLLGGSIGAMLLSAPNSITVGASGAAFGLLGAALVGARIRRIPGLESSLITVAAINFGIGFLPGLNISIGGHLGGFVVGAALAWIAFGPLARLKNPHVVTAIYAVLAVALFAAGIVVADARALF